METREWRITRNELYEHLWTKPLTTLAHELGVWYGELLSISNEYKIPRPPLGYWVKVKYGKKVRRTPLRPLPDREEIVREFHVWVPKPCDEEQRDQARALISSEKASDNRIVVPDSLCDPHPLVAKAEKLLGKAPEDPSHLLVPETAKCLDLQVSRGTLDRALRIMDSLLKELEQREIPIELIDDRQMSTQISVLGETFGICIEEVFDRVERKLTPAQEAEKKRHPWFFGRPEFDRIPTGNLVLRLKNGGYDNGRTNWRDGKVQRLESLLNKFIVALFECAVSKRSARIEREAAEVLRIAESRRKEELRKLQEQERTRLAQLLKDVDAWHQSQKIRAYADAIRTHAEKNEVSDSGQELMEWVSWVSQQADRIDPLCKSPYSVLDETISYW
jgi:hypothetical protein